MGPLQAWKAEVLLDPSALPVRRGAIRYQFWVQCPLCGDCFTHQSKVWSLFSRRQAYHQDIKRNTIKYHLVIYRKNPVTGKKEVAEIIEWMILRSVGHDSRQLAENIWPCRACGVAFGFNDDDRERFKRELAERVTLSWLEQEILRLDPLAAGGAQVSGKRVWELRRLQKLLLESTA